MTAKESKKTAKNKTTARLTDANRLFLEEYTNVTCSWKNSILNKALDQFRMSEKVQEELIAHNCKSAITSYNVKKQAETIQPPNSFKP